MRGRRGGRFPRTTEGFPANGAAPRGGWLTVNIKSRAWPGGMDSRGTPSTRPWGLGRGIHAADTPANPSRPASDNFRVRPPRKRKKKSRSKGKSAWPAALCRAEPTLGCISIRYRILDSDVDSFAHGVDIVSTKADTYQQLGTVGGGAVWVGRTVGAMGPRHASGGLGRTPNPGLAVCAGLRTRARHHRAPMGEGALPARHASQAPERPAATGWAGPRRGVYGVSCQPTPPRHPTDCPLLLLLWLWLLPLRVPGATRPNPFPQGQAGGAAAQACCTSASDARSSSRHCGSSCP